MPRARLTLTIPESVWVGDLSRRHPTATFRVLAALADDDAGTGLVEVVATDLDDVLSEFRASSSVVAFDVLQRANGEALVQFETGDHVLLLPARGSRVPLEMPFEIVDGRATWEVTAPRDRLSELGEQLDYFDIPYTVDYVRQRVEDEPLLTDRQFRVVATAVEAGYYDTPRTCTLTDLADRLGIAKSTASETLHRAEGKIIRQFVEDADASSR